MEKNTDSFMLNPDDYAKKFQDTFNNYLTGDDKNSTYRFFRIKIIGGRTHAEFASLVIKQVEQIEKGLAVVYNNEQVLPPSINSNGKIKNLKLLAFAVGFYLDFFTKSKELIGKAYSLAGMKYDAAVEGSVIKATETIDLLVENHQYISNLLRYFIGNKVKNELGADPEEVFKAVNRTVNSYKKHKNESIQISEKPPTSPAKNISNNRSNTEDESECTVFSFTNGITTKVIKNSFAPSFQDNSSISTNHNYKQ